MARLNSFQLGDTPATFWQKTTLMASLANQPIVLASDFEDVLEAYYMNNGLYEGIQAYMGYNNIWTPGMQPLYNPAHRAVEFHVSHLWPGTLDSAFRIICDDEKVIDAIQKVWAWSNWESEKQLAARWYAEFGTMFVKVHVNKEKKQVRKQNIESRYVTEFECDSSNFITYIRIDSEKSVLNAFTQRPENFFRTEVWDKAKNTYKVYEHKFTRRTPVSQLGNPIEQNEITDFGINFIPIVHAKFKAASGVRGLGVFTHALDKIDEANRIATRLHEIAFRFNRAYIAIGSNTNDAQGRPLPAPRLVDREGDAINSADDLARDESLVLLPGMASMDMMVPNINFAGHLQELTDQMDEIKQDIPELRYYDVTQASNIATDTLRLMLGGAIDSVIEARGSAYSAFIRANKMAMTLGKVNGFDGFRDLGEYESGALDHSFMPTDVIPLTKKEKAEIVSVSVAAGLDVLSAMKHAGYSEDEIFEFENSITYQIALQDKIHMGYSAAAANGITFEAYLKSIGMEDEAIKVMLASVGSDTIPPVGL